MRIYVKTETRIRLRGTRLARWYAQAHQRLYRCTGGRLGARVRVGPNGPDPPVLLLRTRGRRTGRPHTTPLIYLEHGDDLVVIAANAGHPRDPAWCLNLRAQPRATVQVGAHTREVVTEEAVGASRRELWDRFLGMYAGLARYEEGLARTIPVIVLRRAAG